MTPEREGEMGLFLVVVGFIGSGFGTGCGYDLVRSQQYLEIKTRGARGCG